MFGNLRTPAQANPPNGVWTIATREGIRAKSGQHSH